jgi:hypothetical protein
MYQTTGSYEVNYAEALYQAISTKNDVIYPST